MFKSATFKLTMWYLMIVMIISVAFSFVVYHFATGELNTGLHSQTQRIFREFPVFNNNPRLIGRPDADVAAGEHNILLHLADFNLLVLVGAGFASYFLARRTLEPIEAAHEQQKRFTADVSHELRTPLTALKMGSEVALMDKQADKKSLRAALESGLEDAAAMERLINNLLRLTKLDSDQSQTAFTKLQTAAIISDAQDQLAKVAANKHITISVQGDDLPVMGDRDALVQLLVILLDNALKYSSSRSTIELTTSRIDNNVHITLRDHGQGIAPDALPHVFDRFYRQDKARSSSTTEGYGLGLSIAKLIGDRHHGTITLSSQVGKGTTALVSLPLPTKP